jgi:hypothetical protein
MKYFSTLFPTEQHIQTLYQNMNMNHQSEAERRRFVYETRIQILSRPHHFNLTHFDGCFSCGSYSQTTARCLCEFNVQNTINTILEKCTQGTINNHNIREILTRFGGERMKKIARGFGYTSTVKSQASKEIIAIIFGIVCGWFNGRGDDAYVRAASSAWYERDYRYEQSRRQQQWDIDVPNRRVIPPPLMAQLKGYDYGNYKMFAIRGELKEYIKTQYFGLTRYNPLENSRSNQTQQPRNISLYSQVTQHINLQRQSPHPTQPSREALMITYKRRLWRVIQINNQPIPENKEGIQKEPETCPICFEDIGLNKYVLTNCRHTMCSDCVETVMEKCGNKCVICRATVNQLQFESMEQIIRYQDIKIKALVA